MRLRFTDGDGEENYLEVSFWSMYKFWILGLLVTYGITFGLGILIGISGYELI
jgi:hypothetical protein